MRHKICLLRMLNVIYFIYWEIGTFGTLKKKKKVIYKENVYGVPTINPRKILSWHLVVQIQQWKHQNNVWNLFKVNNKDSRTTWTKSFWCLYCQLGIEFTHCSGVFVVDFELVNTGCVLVATQQAFSVQSQQ